MFIGVLTPLVSDTMIMDAYDAASPKRPMAKGEHDADIRLDM